MVDNSKTDENIKSKQFKEFKLTTTMSVTEIGEAPNISKSNSISNTG